jgi:hypothetical protein
MSAYELLDLMGEWRAIVALELMSLLLLLTAYLFLAQFAGRSLHRVQAIIITCLMLWFSFIIIAALYSSLQTLIELRQIGLVAYSEIRWARLFKWVITLGCSLAPLACIHFMVHARHPPPDRRRQ